MDATTFEVTVTVQGDRYAGAVHALVLCAAEYAGSPSAEANAFATSVEALVCECLVERGQALLPVVVRRRAGPVEVLIDRHILTLEI